MVKVVWAQYGVLGVQFWLLPFPGPERYRSPLYASGGTDEPIVPVCTAVCFGFLDPLCGIIPPTSVILSDCLYTYVYF